MFHIVYDCKAGTISIVTSFIQETDDLENNGHLEEARDSQWIEEQLASSNQNNQRRLVKWLLEAMKTSLKPVHERTNEDERATKGWD